MPPSPEEIEAAQTPAGGWTREQLAAWGVPWPPPKDWRRRLIGEHFAEVTRLDALAERDRVI